MILRRSERFKRAFQELPAGVQRKALKAFALFAENPGHPSLRIKKIKGFEDIADKDHPWEGHINRRYRFTFHYESLSGSEEVICVFRNVDNHDECLKNP